MGELAEMGAGVCVFSETQLGGLLSTANIVEQMSARAGTRVRVWAMHGPAVLGNDGLPCTKKQHGVAIAIADRNILVREIARHEHGMVALALRERGTAEVLLIAAYLPPANSFAKARRDTIATAVADLLQKQAGNFAEIIIAGDMNLRLADWGGANGDGPSGA